MGGPSTDAARRSLLLTAVSALFLAALSLLPANRAWLADVADYYARLPREWRAMDVTERLRARHHRNLAVLEYIGASLRPGDVFLLPPPEYVRRHFDPVYWNWCEPKYFYYMLGRWPTVTPDDPGADRATCTVTIDDRGRPVFQRLVGPADVERLRAAFRE